MNHVICALGLCLLTAALGCSIAGSRQSDETPAPASAPAAARVTAQDLAAMEPLVEKAEASIQSRMVGADAAQRRELERQASVVRFARFMLSTAPEDIESRQTELQYIRSMLPEQAAGRDYMMETHGSHAALIEHPGVEWGGVTFTRFWVSLPTNYESRKDWPVVFFLHGATQATNMIEPFRGPTAAFPGGVGMPCVGVTPKSEIQGGWTPEVLNNLLDFVLAHYNVDADRVSVVGHSRGAGGTLTWAMASPERISAIAPTAGFGNLLEEYKIAHIPAWFVHGTQDSPGRSVRMAEWLRRYGAHPRLTLIQGGGHMDTFQELARPEFWTWMASQRRTAPPTGLEAPEFGEDGLTKVEQIDLPARRLLHAGPTPGDVPPAQSDGALETRLYEAANGAGLECGVPAALVRPLAGDAGQVTGGVFVRGTAAAPEGLEIAELASARYASVLWRGDAGSLADTCSKVREKLSAAGLKPTGEVLCLYWGTVPGPRPAAGAQPPAGRRFGGGFGRGPGLYELQFALEP